MRQAAEVQEKAVSDFDEVRQRLDPEGSLAALDRIEAENRRFREALERILAAPLRGGRWYREHDNPRLIARLALSANPEEEPATGPTGPTGLTGDTGETGYAGDTGDTAADRPARRRSRP
jgi:hypothetical protein